MNTLPSITALVGMKVRHGSPGYENKEVIADVTWNGSRAIVEFESGSLTNMTETELDVFMDHGEVSYRQHFASPADWGHAVMYLI